MMRRMLIAVVAVLVLFGFGALYVKDSATVAQAVIVDKYFKDYCRTHNSYPDYETVVTAFPELYPDHDWYYWPDESLSRATYQYPMTLPMPQAPGRSKFSEFFPVIYSYAVLDPCEGLIQVQ